MLKFVKLYKNSKSPTRATSGSAGYDLYACIENDVLIKSGDKVIVPSGIAIELPENTAGMIYTRSGLGIKHGIHVTNGVGVIDSDYRGEIKIGLHNLSHEDFVIKPNERVAQLVIQPVLCPELVEVSELSDTKRGDGGLGSTGLK
ncbi:MAG: dUTP diphosphatase [Clostridia bacterium]